MRRQANAVKGGKPALFVTEDEIRQIALERGLEQVEWLKRRGFTDGLICDALNEWFNPPDATYPSDIEILEACEALARKVYPKLALVR